MKSGKWRMVTDLRAVNKKIQPMSPLQSGIPLPSLLPKGWHIIVIDLKDCFFTIPLQKRRENNLLSQCLLTVILNLKGDTIRPSFHGEWSIAPPYAITL